MKRKEFVESPVVKEKMEKLLKQGKSDKEIYDYFNSEYQNLSKFETFTSWIELWKKEYGYQNNELFKEKEEGTPEVKTETKKSDNPEVTIKEGFPTITINPKYKSSDSTICRIDRHVNKAMVDYCSKEGFSFYQLLNSMLEQIFIKKNIKLNIESDLSDYRIKQLISQEVERALKEKKLI